MTNEIEITSLVEYISLITNQDRNYPYWQNFDKYYYDGVIEKYNNIIKDYKTNSSVESYLSFFLQNDSTIYDFLWYLEQTNYYSSENIRFYYRGNSDKNYKLAPGIYMANMKEENYFYREMQVRCAMQLSQNSLLDRLVYLQHYECPTRLLDITTNPLVALYFACDGNKHMDGAVYRFLIRERDVLYPNSDRAQMLSHLCEFSQDEQNQIMVYAMLSYSFKKFKQLSSGKYAYPIIEKLYHSIKRETAAFEREMCPFDLLRPAFVQVSRSNPRIVKQDGAFILSGLTVDEFACDDRISKYVSQKIIIPANNKKNILRELEEVGICEATLFPEVDKVAAFLKQ